AKGAVRISVPTAFLRSWINGHYLDLITELWRKEDPRVLKVEIVIRSAARHIGNNAVASSATSRKVTQHTQTAIGSGTLTGARVERSISARPNGSHAEYKPTLFGSPL